MGRSPLIIFLADGEPTASVMTSRVILSNICQALGNRVSLFSLAFGDDTDFPLLCHLPLENRGAARCMYEGTDAALPLEGFYEEISMPLLADMHLDYLGGLIGASPWAFSPSYFDSSELVVAGQMQAGRQAGKQELGIHLAAHGPKGQLLVACHSEVATNSSQKNFGVSGEPAYNVAHFTCYLWAYITIGELLRDASRPVTPPLATCWPPKSSTCPLSTTLSPPLTSLVMVQPKEASGKARVQTSTAAGPGTIIYPHPPAGKA